MVRRLALWTCVLTGMAALLVSMLRDDAWVYHNAWATRQAGISSGRLFLLDARNYKPSAELLAAREKGRAESSKIWQSVDRPRTAARVPRQGTQLDWTREGKWAWTSPLALLSANFLVDKEFSWRDEDGTLADDEASVEVRWYVRLPAALPGLLLLAWPICAAVGELRDRLTRRRLAGRCFACGYDLRATAGDVCSECGATIGPPPFPRWRIAAALLLLLAAAWMGAAVHASMTAQDPMPTPGMPNFAAFWRPFAISLPPENRGVSLIVWRGSMFFQIAPASDANVWKLSTQASTLPSTLAWLDFGVARPPVRPASPSGIVYPSPYVVRVPALPIVALLIVAACLLLRRRLSRPYGRR